MGSYLVLRGGYRDQDRATVSYVIATMEGDGIEIGLQYVP